MLKDIYIKFMINVIPNDLYIDICKFLDVKTKYNIRLLNNNFNLNTKKLIFGYIGNVIKYHLVYDSFEEMKSRIDIKSKITYNTSKSYKLRTIKHIIKCINEYFFEKSNKPLPKKYNFRTINNVEFGIVIRLMSKSRLQCINIIRNNKNIFRKHEKHYNDDYEHLNLRNKHLNYKLPTCYSLLLANSIN